MLPRQVRSEARRLALLEAAIRVIGRGGIAAATHRAIAAEAGVPLGATTYYFASRQALVAQALDHAVTRASARLAALAEPARHVETPAALAELIAAEQEHWFVADRGGVLAAYEVYLEAARRPELAGAVERWNAAYLAVLAPALARLGAADPDGATRLVMAALDGLVLDRLTRPAVDVRAALAADLARVIAGTVRV